MRLLWLMACCLTLLLVSCASTVQQDQGVPPPITLADTSPDALQATVGITIGGYTASSRGTTEIAIQFMSQGHLVMFQNGEALACNGAKPMRLMTGFDQRYPTATISGQMFSCTYTSGHSSAHIQFLIPRAPTILVPADRTTVAPSAATVVHFQADGEISGIVALGAQDKAIAHITAPGIATVDTSQFAAGTGHISLTQYPQITDASAPAFASLQLSCTAMASVDVVWG